mmetsp:Transcript_13957/g.32772  ORF Transcript_13957/g.32772 Transcript_13957/m.32772 type:complete len:327 (+) Transcript_13957:126-1106(+)
MRQAELKPHVVCSIQRLVADLQELVQGGNRHYAFVVLVHATEHGAQVPCRPPEFPKGLLNLLMLLDRAVKVLTRDDIGHVRGPVLLVQGIADAVDVRLAVQLGFLLFPLAVLILRRLGAVHDDSCDEIQDEERRDKNEEEEEADKVNPRVQQRPHVVHPTFKGHDLEEREHAERDGCKLLAQLANFHMVLGRQHRPAADEDGGKARRDVEPQQQQHKDPEKRLDAHEEGADEMAQLREDAREAEEPAQAQDLQAIGSYVFVQVTKEVIVEDEEGQGHLHCNEQGYNEVEHVPIVRHVLAPAQDCNFQNYLSHKEGQEQEVHHHELM